MALATKIQLFFQIKNKLSTAKSLTIEFYLTESIESDVFKFYVGVDMMQFNVGFNPNYQPYYLYIDCPATDLFNLR